MKKTLSVMLSVFMIISALIINAPIAKALGCEHSYDNVCDATCNLCGEERNAPHEYGAWEFVTSATCVQNGMLRAYCIHCNKETTSPTEKTGHNYGEWTYAGNDPLGNTIETRTCKVCGAFESKNNATVSGTISNGTVILQPGVSFDIISSPDIFQATDDGFSHTIKIEPSVEYFPNVTAPVVSYTPQTGMAYAPNDTITYLITLAGLALVAVAVAVIVKTKSSSEDDEADDSAEEVIFYDVTK